MHTRMRDDQIRMLQNLVIEQQQININCTRAPTHCAHTLQVVLNLLSNLKQSQWCEACMNFTDQIEKIRLIHIANWCGLIKVRLSMQPDIGCIVQHCERLPNCCLAITQIGAETEKHLMCKIR